MKTRAEGVNVSMCIKHIHAHAHTASLYVWYKQHVQKSLSSIFFFHGLIK